MARKLTASRAAVLARAKWGATGFAERRRSVLGTYRVGYRGPGGVACDGWGESWEAAFESFEERERRRNAPPPPISEEERAYLRALNRKMGEFLFGGARRR